jgi:hypothetical protein
MIAGSLEAVWSDQLGKQIPESASAILTNIETALTKAYRTNGQAWPQARSTSADGLSDRRLLRSAQCRVFAKHFTRATVGPSHHAERSVCRGAAINLH